MLGFMLFWVFGALAATENGAVATHMAGQAAEPRPAFCTVRWNINNQRRSFDFFYVLCPRSVPDPDGLQAYADRVMANLPATLSLSAHPPFHPVDYVPFHWTGAGWTLMETFPLVQGLPSVRTPQSAEGRCDYAVMIGDRGRARRIDIACQAFTPSGAHQRARDYELSMRNALRASWWIHEPGDPAPCISSHHVFRLTGADRGPEEAAWLFTPLADAPACPQQSRPRPEPLAFTFNTAEAPASAPAPALALADTGPFAASCIPDWMGDPVEGNRIVALSLRCPVAVPDAKALQDYADSLTALLPMPLTVAFDRGAEIVDEFRFLHTGAGWTLPEPGVLVHAFPIGSQEVRRSGRQGRCDFAGVVANDGRLNPLEIVCQGFRPNGRRVTGAAYESALRDAVGHWRWIRDPAHAAPCVTEHYRFLGEGHDDVAWLAQPLENAPACPLVRE